LILKDILLISLIPFLSIFLEGLESKKEVIFYQNMLIFRAEKGTIFYQFLGIFWNFLGNKI